nr:immunoglobulin light chain junction region [Macaca mulatta]MOY14799.1 immunoglobulin light chain junction region [Macaca mulatta]MOY14822.1 immunoglobulin light chain junction region [Macaca mulatta]MOY14897.1 immunoglobulin light chain junction region [Macaca mulatta]MOY14912.1 immunoglobulin light chain junction region [Macaca mulatta]
DYYCAAWDDRLTSRLF